MIAEKFVDRFARNSGIKDKLIAEREVVLTYALDALRAAGVTAHLAFKGGTALRKLVFGSSGSFSMDLDFTLCAEEPERDEALEQFLMCSVEITTVSTSMREQRTFISPTMTLHLAATFPIHTPGTAQAYSSYR